MPKGYIYAEVAVFDAPRYEHWRYRVVESIAKAGGRFIVRRGDSQVLAGYNKQMPLVFIVEFESRERAHEWYRSELPLMDYLGTAARLDVVLLTGEGE
jgi:uncharacterized protein (DUF1330 family)